MSLASPSLVMRTTFASTHTLAVLQHFLHSLYDSTSLCGLIISLDKSCIFTLLNPRTLPAFTMGNSVIPVCTQYVCLGAPVTILSSTPARPPVHPVVQDLLTRLQLRLTPLRWLLNNSTGVSIPWPGQDTRPSFDQSWIISPLRLYSCPNLHWNPSKSSRTM